MDLLDNVEKIIFGGTKKEAIALHKKAEKYNSKGDYESAKSYWLKSAKYGNPYAMYKIGLYHYHGMSGKVNYQKAFRAWEMATEVGHKESRYCLAVCYLKGYGTQKNETAAVKILEELKNTNHMRAIYLLSECYRFSLGGLPKNIEKADYYAVLACKIGYNPACDGIIEKL